MDVEVVVGKEAHGGQTPSYTRKPLWCMLALLRWVWWVSKSQLDSGASTFGHCRGDTGASNALWLDARTMPMARFPSMAIG